ncbi:glyoxalase superfamily protein [Bacillus sp. KH172YL63]|uniref:glyoxalase superfamily protein n=1 Tax=Bacillus sp. KH172YL63 TaxID=2709784 RepID=UPI0013E43A80|nr:glyoxalase superfamily protein [Bacillus sp. KH172YL63]BCB02731.1 bleomycin resistance protein [Bacillus sp. KH172YL63]
MNGQYHMKHPVPILRIFDVEKAKEFYLNILEYKLDWEHRFEPALPLYMQVSKGDCVLHLSEHHGDCSPGAAIRIGVEGIEDFHAGITAKNYPYANPEIKPTPWQTLEFQMTDPFGNKLIFHEGR